MLILLDAGMGEMRGNGGRYLRGKIRITREYQNQKLHGTGGLLKRRVSQRTKQLLSLPYSHQAGLVHLHLHFYTPPNAFAI